MVDEGEHEHTSASEQAIAAMDGRGRRCRGRDGTGARFARFRPTELPFSPCSDSQTVCAQQDEAARHIGDATSGDCIGGKKPGVKLQLTVLLQ